MVEFFSNLFLVLSALVGLGTAAFTVLVIKRLFDKSH